MDLASKDYAMQIEKGRLRTQKVVESYAVGKPLYPRTVLKDLDHQMDLNPPSVSIRDYHGNLQEYSLKAPQWASPLAKACISYRSYQSLTNHDPKNPDALLHEQSPISISYGCHGRRDQLTRSIDELKVEYALHNNVWRASDARRNLDQLLTSKARSLNIRKVVAFGLGDLGRATERAATRSFTQHAAVSTIAVALNQLTGHGIQCFLQDPAYGATDMKFLQGLGFTILADPKGFLEIDENTLVFSISPNVPIKQIVSDVQWPAMMIWNTVESQEEEETEWRTEEVEGENCRISPHTTDPDSPRVRDMITYYEQYPFPGEEDQFSHLTVYFRK